jgi:hypothetical protein
MVIDRLTIFGILASVAALVLVVELVRQRRLREDYSLLWLATALALLLLSAFRPLLDATAVFLGVITYPPAALFAVAFAFVLAILLHFSTVLTRLARENKTLAQETALLRREIAVLRQQVSSDDAGRDDQGSDQQRRVE